MGVVAIDITGESSLSEQPETGHNRWHWDIAPAARCAPGDEVLLGTRDALDGQLDRSSTSADVERVDVGRIHPLTGPVWIEGAEPGDLLEVEVLEVQAPGYGFTSQRPGLGLLAEEMAEPYLVHWNLDGDRAQSDQLPGVAIKGNPFLGIVGVAPSAALVAKSIERESCTARSALEPRSAIPPTERIASEGLRTGPPRENGGNVDVKQLAAGARILLPVWQQGGLLSVGDAHFAQGDGEVCGTAIEMRSVSRLRLTLHKAGLDLSRLPMPFIEHSFSDIETGPAFTVLGYPEAGHPDRLRSAAAAAIRSLCTRISERYDYPLAAAYALCSVAADLRVAQVVNEPYVSVSATIMLDVFSDGGARLRERIAY
jgi:formamidase